jgi:hypothetical protein
LRDIIRKQYDIELENPMKFDCIYPEIDYEWTRRKELEQTASRRYSVVSSELSHYMRYCK